MIWMQRNWFCTPQHDLFFSHLYMFTAPSILLKLTKALQFDRIVVCPLLTVAFIPRLSVQAEAIFADFLSKKQAFIRIYGGGWGTGWWEMEQQTEEFASGLSVKKHLILSFTLDIFTFICQRFLKTQQHKILEVGANSQRWKHNQGCLWYLKNKVQNISREGPSVKMVSGLLPCIWWNSLWNSTVAPAILSKGHAFEEMCLPINTYFSPLISWDDENSWKEFDGIL